VSKAFTYPALRSTRDNFKCPNCGQALTLNTDAQSKTYSCTNNHSFDMAREGYLNLLLAQHKRSRNPGDSDDMIRSRQRFLSAGYYSSLSDAIVRQVAESAEGFNQSLIDLGCGEGHYMQQLRNASADLKLLGIDISKFAVRLAAKRKMDARLVVDSAFNIPLFENRVDTAISVFSPISSDETARILKPGGTLIMVGPGEQHLSGLTELIYDKTVPHGGNPLEADAQFTLQESIEVKRDISVQGSDILDLLTMTPYYWHTRPEQQAMLAKRETLETLIHFTIKIYKNENP
jgi:23S rRNA (guanine745-N1)-methyltransferase